MNKFNYLEICGVISSGKTTIATIIEELGFNAVLEKFEINKFLQQFYENPDDHAFETEIAFLIQHYNHIKRAKKENSPFACDFSLVLDLAFADVTLSEKEKKVFIAVYNEISEQVSNPDVLINLKCDPYILLKRIQDRGRKVESTIDIEYLEKLDRAISKRIEKIEDKVKIVTIDSEKYNFANNDRDREYIKSILKEKTCT